MQIYSSSSTIGKAAAVLGVIQAAAIQHHYMKIHRVMERIQNSKDGTTYIYFRPNLSYLEDLRMDQQTQVLIHRRLPTM